MTLTCPLAEVLSDDEFVITEKSTYKINRDVFKSILKEFRKGISEDIFIQINKRRFPAKKYDIVTLDIK